MQKDLTTGSVFKVESLPLRGRWPEGPEGETIPILLAKS